MASSLPVALSLVGVVAPGLVPFSSLSVMVEVDGDRENALSGPRCVSLSSAQDQLDSLPVAAKGRTLLEHGVGRTRHREQWKRRDILLVSFHDILTVPGTTAQQIRM